MDTKFNVADFLGAEYWDKTRKMWARVTSITTKGQIVLTYQNGDSRKTSVSALNFTQNFRKV